MPSDSQRLQRLSEYAVQADIWPKPLKAPVFRLLTMARSPWPRSGYRAMLAVQ
jgi:hypothetical protein